MRSGLWYAGAIVVLAAVQRAWPDLLRLHSLAPDLLVVMVCAIGLFRGPLSAYGAGLGAGLLAAAAERGPFGALLAGRMAVGLLAGLLRGRVFADRLLVAPVVAALAVLAADLAQLVLAPPSEGFAQWLREFVVRALYSAACAPLLFWFARTINRRYPGRADE